MSQPQPAYYPPQPPKKSSTGTIIVVVVVVVALVAGLGAYGAYRIFQTFPQQNGGGSSNTNTISCQSCTETVPVTTNSTLYITAQSATLTLNLGTRVTVDLHVDSQSCSITINGGYTRLTITGQSNAIYARNTVLLSNVDSGQGNIVHQ